MSAHVIVVGNQKGGAGKSTIAMHLAVALMRMGRRTGALDLDVRQRTLSRYVENRAATIAATGANIPTPQMLDVTLSAARQGEVADMENEAALAVALKRLSATSDYIVIDVPAGDSHISRAAHAEADTLVTPMNDSFVDFDLLGAVSPSAPEDVRPSVYSEWVWECRKRKAQASGRAIDWVVLRNRTATSRIEAKNKQAVGDALKTLSTRIGFRLVPGLSERVIFRELFLQGLTLLDADRDGLKMTHLAARQELRDLFIALKLPGFEGEALRF
ncbi:MAG: AAA family ATPase [Alphaproteobacteria bacterium]|nr:AAA family ATPase [Alphaproteobacteria bacterium]